MYRATLQWTAFRAESSTAARPDRERRVPRTALDRENPGEDFFSEVMDFLSEVHVPPFPYRGHPPSLGHTYRHTQPDSASHRLAAWLQHGFFVATRDAHQIAFRRAWGWSLPHTAFVNRTVTALCSFQSPLIDASAGPA
jgi:hypothetical protein